jgi:D-3-phosphoglycerate dehydrogenase
VIRVVVCDGLDESAVARLKGVAEIKLELHSAIQESDLATKLGGARLVVVRSATQLNSELLQSLPALSGILRAGVGIDNVDLEAATRLGIGVWNAPDGAFQGTAEWALAAVFALARGFPLARDLACSGKWGKKELGGATQIEGASLGIVGLGNIGRRLKKMAEAIGMQVLVHDPALKEGSSLSLDELLAASDFVSIHVPLLESTAGLFSSERLARMKKGARLVCAARGGIVDELALLQAIESGHIGGAALDVFEKEPWDPSLRKLLSHPKVLATPHVASSTREGQLAIGAQVADLIAALATDLTHRRIPNHRPPLNSVDWKVKWLKS